MPVTTINDYVQITLAKNQSNSMESLVLISQKLVERLNAEKRDVAIDFTRHDLVRPKSDKADLMAFKAKIADNLSALSKAKGAIEWVDNTLDDMLLNLQVILGSSSAEARAAAAVEFNEDLAFINSKVDGANQKIGYQNINLVGGTTTPDFGVDNLYVRTSAKGGSAFVEGAYLGSRFNVEDAEGDLWRYDDTTDSYIEYSSDGTGTPSGASVAAEGLTVDSYDADTGAVVFGGTGSLQGTVVRGGIEVLGSEFYGDFADDAAVQRAIDDVTAAISYVGSQGSSIKANATLLKSSSSMTQERINHLSNEISNITQEEIDATAAEAKAAQLKVTLAVNNINLTMQHSTGLIQNLMTLTEGRQSAVGVFGMLGY